MAKRKAVLDLSQLPGRDPVDGTYKIRYRIITEDRNRVSEWSPIFTVSALSGEELLEKYGGEGYLVDFIVKSSEEFGRVSYNILWNVPEIFQEFPYYDIFVYWDKPVGDDSGWEYYKSTASEDITIIVPEGSSYSTLDVVVQIPTYPRAISDKAFVFNTIQIEL